ncbi:tag-312 [Bugula neritina]|uniref:Tag-312 n=1 Tax=Bugula neritina TaxID=10212 RepID=A0A7J7J7G3_BUGNE|nr:tag-312 [Bugula neritina]
MNVFAAFYVTYYTRVINKQLNETNNSLNEELNDIKGKIHSDQGQSPTSNTFSSTQSIQLPKAFERTGPKYPGISLCEELEQASLASSTEYGTADGRLHTDGRQHTAHHNNANEQHHIFQPRKGTLTENLTRPFLVETQSLEGVDELTDNPRISNRRRSHKSDMYHDSTDTLLSISSTFTDYAPQRLYKVIFVGDAGVGKTSFVTHFCKGYFQLNTAATLGIDFYTKNIEVDRIKITLQLWDTAGQERFRCISTPYFRKVDGVVLMYDCCTESSFLSVREWIEIIRSNSDMDDLPIMICANKIDLRGEKEELGFKVISSEMGEQLANECKTMFSELSAKTGEQLNSCIHRLGRIMKEREDEGIKRYEHGLQIGSFKEGKKKCCNG